MGVNTKETNAKTTSQINKKKAKKDKRDNILIVGDWFVDEHWITGVHRSSTSSRTGQAHFRALHNINSAVESFCGAGKVASLLHNIEGEKEKFSIYGVGLWHDDDTEILESMFDPQNLIGQNLYHLSRKKTQPVDRVKLINLSGLVKEEEKNKIATTRIIRIYNPIGPKYVQYQRIDWEIRRESRDEQFFPDKIEPKHIRALYEYIKTYGVDSFDAVIIKDLCKGVITPGLIKILARQFGKSAQWFVSTKSWKPDWYKELKNVNLKLLLIPQVAAQEAIRRGVLSCWITRAGYPGEKAIEEIEGIHQTVGDKNNPDIIVLPDGFSVLAYSPRNRDENCIVQTISNQKDLTIDMGMASVFLPALVALILRSDKKKTNLKDLLAEALQATFDWVKFDGERVLKPAQGWSPSNKKFMDKSKDVNNSHGDYKFESFNLKDEKDKWEKAMEDIGVIDTEPGRCYFDLSRAMIEINGYVCCGEEKRKELAKLIRGIKLFLKSRPKHHVCCLLAAKPGSGKTYLVRRLAESLNLRFLPFNITQMISRNDILEIFDSIVTAQAQKRDQPLLVFVDEINATVAGDNVHSAFLAPIEDGVYIRGGKPFHIDPCIWVFSGTDNPVPSNTTNIKTPKGSDFVSRLNLGILDIEKQDDEKKQEIENVYIGVSLILTEFPDVRYITDKVLKVFQFMPSDVRIRELKHFVKSFKDIQYGEVIQRNVPTDLLSRFQGFKKEVWESLPEEKRVEIMP